MSQHFDNRFYNEMSSEPLGMTKIGTYNSIKNTKFNRLNKINNITIYNSKKTREINNYYEITRILYNLDIPIQLSPRIIYNIKLFYNKLPKGTIYRSPDLLTPVAIYITCLQDFVFINVKELYKTSKCNTHNFGKCLKLIYKLFPNIYYKFMSKEFRIKTILNQLMGLKLYFRFPNSFMFIASQFLETYYETLKNTKPSVITAKIFRLTKDDFGNKMKEFTDINICNRLGIKSSVCSNIKLKEGKHVSNKRI